MYIYVIIYIYNYIYIRSPSPREKGGQEIHEMGSICPNAPHRAPLGFQAAILCCVLASVPVTSVPTCLNVDKKPVARMYENLEAARTKRVSPTGTQDSVWSQARWADVEADEVQGRVHGFEAQCLCSMGNGEVLWKEVILKPSSCTFQTQSARPISRRDWAKHLANREVTLHTRRSACTQIVHLVDDECPMRNSKTVDMTQ